MTTDATACGAAFVEPNRLRWERLTDDWHECRIDGAGDLAVALVRHPSGWRVRLEAAVYDDGLEYDVTEWRDLAHGTHAEAEALLPELLGELDLCACAHDWNSHHERWHASGSDWTEGVCQMPSCGCETWTKTARAGRVR